MALHAVYQSAWRKTVLKGMAIGVAYLASPIRGDCDDRHLDFHRIELDRLLDARRAKDTPPETVAKVQSSE
jgi:hypothetical protein